jgi:hypothetical protein
MSGVTICNRDLSCEVRGDRVLCNILTDEINDEVIDEIQVDVVRSVIGDVRVSVGRDRSLCLDIYRLALNPITT